MSKEIVLVTGASAGIGRELARCFAAEGAKLLLVARRRKPMEALADELRDKYRTQSEIITLDLAQPQSATQLWQHTENNGTKVDVLVNNAGFGLRGQFWELPLDRQLQMIQVNITSLAHLARLYLPGIIERRRGGILNVASTASFAPGPGMAMYYATKAFVLSLTEAIAFESTGTGVKISALCPGPTATEFCDVAGAKETDLFKRASMSAAEVARQGHAAYRAGKVVGITGASNKLLAFGTRVAPRALVRRITGRLNSVR